MKQETSTGPGKPEEKPKRGNADEQGDRARNEKVESTEKPSREEVISHWRDPVTNQDEQEKITNSSGDDIPMPDK